MKQRYFYMAVTAVTAVLCFSGCGDDADSRYADYSSYKPFSDAGAAVQEKSGGGAVYGGGGKTAVIEHRAGGDDPAQTRAPFHTLTRITALFGGGGEDESQQTSEPPEDWFRFGAEDAGVTETWYRFNRNDTEYTRAVSLYPAVTEKEGLKDSEKQPEQPRSTMKPAETEAKGDG